MNLAEGEYRLLFVAPERLVQPDFLRRLAQTRHPPLRHRRGPLHQPLGTRFPP